MFRNVLKSTPRRLGTGMTIQDPAAWTDVRMSVPYLVMVF